MGEVRPPSQARSQRRRDALVQAAAELIGEAGIPAVTHRAVAARAGLPPSATGYFFASIDDLTAEALRIYTALAIEEFMDLARAGAGDGRGFAADALIEAVARRQADQRLALAQISTYIEASRNPRLRQPVAEAVEAFRQLAERLLRLFGLPRAESAAAAFQALLDGVLLRRLATPDMPPDPEAVVEALEALLAGYLLDASERRAVRQRLAAIPGGQR